MKERPILFSTEMVKAILAGKKTQTRRVCKLPINEIYKDGRIEYGNGFDTYTNHPKYCSPYGQVGDILWVRETWCKHKGEYLHRADGIDVNEFRWKPSIHMPKSACRIKLQITNIRVERLNSISESDAIAEGIEGGYTDDGYEYTDYLGEGSFKSPIESYISLWDKINGKDSHKENPWVWVVEFEKLKS